MQLLREAISVLDAAGARVYVDAGHARWLSAPAAAEMLSKIGATRFALNVSNYCAAEESLAYGEAVCDALSPGGSSFVFDVGRSGAGAAKDGAWCNPPHAALGPPPCLQRIGRCDARLWVKPPGESDGPVPEGAPSAGAYWEEGALALAKRRGA